MNGFGNGGDSFEEEFRYQWYHREDDLLYLAF